MIFLYLLLSQVSTITLDTKGRFIENYSIKQIKYNPDHGLLLMAPSEFYHFDINGKLINRIGRKGQGPGEFGYIMSGVICNNYYWIVDGLHFTVDQFSMSGDFIESHKKYFSDLNYGNGNVIYAKDGKGYKQLAKERRETLVALELGSSVKENGNSFHMLPARVPEITYQYASPLLDCDDNNVYVTCQVDPTVWVYNQKTKKLTETINLALPGYVLDPPTSFKPVGPGGAKEFWKWEDSFSRIVGFKRYKQGFAVVYEIPDPFGVIVDDKQRAYNLAIVSDDGKNIHTQRCSGLLVGVRNNRLVFFIDWDETIDEDPTYYLKEIEI